MASYLRSLLLIAVLGTFGLCAAVKGPAIRVIDNPAGWPIPNHKSTPISSGKFVHEGLTDAVYTEFEVEEPVWLPHYYLEGDTLHLLSFKFRLSRFRQLQRNGKPFAYTAFATGAEVGTAANVWWADSDGDGVFEEYSWSYELEIPGWVRDRAQ